MSSLTHFPPGTGLWGLFFSGPGCGWLRTRLGFHPHQFPWNTRIGCFLGWTWCHSIFSLFWVSSLSTLSDNSKLQLAPSIRSHKFQVSYMFPPSALVPLVLSKFLAEHVKGQPRHLILVASCQMEVPWLPTVLNILADVPQQCPVIKDLCGCLGRPGYQRSAISAFNPLAAQQCVLHRQGFSSWVCQAVVGATWVSISNVYQQCWKEWVGWCAWQGVPNNAISAPK